MTNCCEKPDCSHLYMTDQPGVKCSCGKECSTCSGLVPNEEMVLDFIKLHQPATCVELSNWFGKGDQELYKRDDKGNDENIITAFNLGEPLANILINLLNRADIITVPVHPLLYVMDGSMPGLPIARNTPKNGYKSPHWAPVGFTTREYGIRNVVSRIKNKKDRKEILANIKKKKALTS